MKGVGKDGRRRTEPRTHPLGLYPIISLKEAREAARKFLADPQKALAQADAGSFKEVAEDFLRRHVEAHKLRSQAEIERCLNKYILPAGSTVHSVNSSAVTWPHSWIRLRTSTAHGKPTFAWRSSVS